MFVTHRCVTKPIIQVTENHRSDAPVRHKSDGGYVAFIQHVVFNLLFLNKHNIHACFFSWSEWYRVCVFSLAFPRVVRQPCLLFNNILYSSIPRHKKPVSSIHITLCQPLFFHAKLWTLRLWPPYALGLDPTICIATLCTVKKYTWWNSAGREHNLAWHAWTYKLVPQHKSGDLFVQNLTWPHNFFLSVKK